MMVIHHMGETNVYVQHQLQNGPSSMMIQEACAVMDIIYSQSIIWKKNMTTNAQHWNQMPEYPTLDDCPK